MQRVNLAGGRLRQPRCNFLIHCDEDISPLASSYRADLKFVKQYIGEWGQNLFLHVYILVLFAKGGGTLRAIIRWDLESRCHIHQVVRSHVHLSWLYTDQKEGGGWLGGSSVPEEYVCLRDFVHNRMHERTWDGSIKQHTLEDIGVSSIQGTPAPAAPLEDAIRRLYTEIIFRCLYNSIEAHWDTFYLLCYFHIHFQMMTCIPDVRISISDYAIFS